LRALALSCNAELRGDEVGSLEVAYLPRRSPQSLNETFSIYEYSKGSVSGNAIAVLHALMLVLARARSYSNVIVRGETYSVKSLHYDLFENVLLPLHRQQGIYAYSNQSIAGFGLRSKGEVWLEVEPSALNGFQWTQRGQFLGARMVVSAAEVDISYLTRAKKHAEALFNKYGLRASFDIHEVRAREAGVCATLYAQFEKGLGGGSSFSARQNEIERVVEEALDSFLKWHESDATVDAHIAPLLILPAVFAADYTTVFTTPCITPKLQTVVWVVKQFLPARIVVTGALGEPGKISIGHQMPENTLSL
jgi:RNA 3'-terminal phosphate cyclase (ATP)